MAFEADVPVSEIALPEGDESGDVAADGNGAGAAGTGRRRRRGGRGRNRRERGADGEVLADGAQGGDEPADHEAAHAPIEQHFAEPVEPVAEHAFVEPSPLPIHEAPVVEAQAVHHDDFTATEPLPPVAEAATDFTEETHVAPLIGEIEPAAVMEMLPSEPVEAPKVEAAPVRDESLIAKAMATSPAPAAPIPAPPVRTVDLQSVLSNAGLQLVATDASKLETVRTEIAHAAPPPRPARERKRPSMPAPEPLAQVETRKH